MFQSLDIWTVVGAILLILGTFWAGWAILRPKISKVLQEFGQLSSAIGLALEDNKITKEEQAVITAEFLETQAALKELLTKHEKKLPQANSGGGSPLA